MKYSFVCLLALVVPGCADHHDLTQCKGPYLALLPPPPSVAQTPDIKPPVVIPAPLSATLQTVQRGR